MALTKVNSAGVKDNELVNADLHTAANIDGSKLADDSISLAKLEHGTSSNNGKFLRANNGADPSFETVDLTTKFTNAGGDTITGDFTIASGTTNKNINIDVSDKVRFDDNLKATFGSSDDLEIYHNGSHSYINDAGQGTLKLQSGGATKAEVLSTGLTITGTCTATSFTGDGSALTGVSSPEVYGFNTDSNGNLIVTTTNGGANNISGTAFDAFEDVIFAATGFTFSVNASGNLIATI